jgi:hypothetical protein
MSCEQAPVVWLHRWPPPLPAGDDGGGLAGLGFGRARRRRLRRPRVAQAERRGLIETGLRPYYIYIR